MSSKNPLLVPTYQILFEEFLDNFEETVFQRIIPSFNTVYEEADIMRESHIQAMADRVNEDTNISEIYAEAECISANYWLYTNELKNHTLNSYGIYLFHSFEKNLQKILLEFYQCNNVSSSQKNKILHNITNFMELELPELISNKDWMIINKDLKLLVNVLKHGYGSSFDKLEEINDAQKYFNNGKIHPDYIVIECFHLQVFIDSIKRIWRLIAKKYIYSL